MTTPPPQIGVIGLGSIGRTHIATWTNIGFAPAAVTDTMPAVREQAASEGNWTVFESGEALIASGEVDIVSICTPPAFHRNLAISALNAGLTVLCEKPLAHTLEDAEAIAEAARGAKGRLHVGFCHRFEPAIVAIKELIQSGQLGTIITLRNRFAGHMDHPENTWFANASISGGGALADTTIHSIDMFRYLLGDAVQVRSLASTQSSDLGPALDVEDTGVILLANGHGALGVLEASWRTPPGEWAVSVYGTAGSAMFDYATGTGTVTPASGESSPLEFGEGDRFADEFRHVAHVWQHGGEPKANVHDGVAANRILAQAYQDNARQAGG
jgi:predicted dehydrogenase